MHPHAVVTARVFKTLPSTVPARPPRTSSMAPPPKHGVTELHPIDPGHIRMLRFRRGPHDPRWEAQFRVDGIGAWSLAKATGEGDFTRAAFKATAMLAEAQANVASGRDPFPRRRPSAAVSSAAHTGTGAAHHERSVGGPTFGDLAERVIAALEAERAATIARTRDPARAHKFTQHILNLRKRLIPHFGNTPIVSIGNPMVDSFVEEYRVTVRAAAPAADGQKPKAQPVASTIGSVNNSFQKVMGLAVKRGFIERRHRPQMSQAGLEESTPRPGFWDDEFGILCAYMTDEWIETGEGPGRRRLVSKAGRPVRRSKKQIAQDTRRLVRAYIHFVGATGIRPGVEVETLRWGQIAEGRHRDGGSFHYVAVRKGEGKIKRGRKARGRWAIVRDAGHADFKLAINDLYVLNPEAKLDDHLFRLPGRDGPPDFLGTFRALLDDTGLRADPVTDLRRTPYSLRHYYATSVLLEGEVSMARLADQMGTSVEMIDRYYSKLNTLIEAAALQGKVRSDAARELTRAVTAARLREEPDPGPHQPDHEWEDDTRYEEEMGASF